MELAQISELSGSGKLAASQARNTDRNSKSKLMFLL